MDTSHQQTRKLPIRLDLPEGRIEGEIEVPGGTMRLVDLASATLGLSGTVADIGTRITVKLGSQVSCSKGCGACCRQLVPLSPPEALMLAELVASLPEDTRIPIQNRFAEAIRKLNRTGISPKLARLQKSSSISEADMQAITKTYFLQQIPCPFLKDECCSIYASRPSRCREYLVTSSPVHCQNPYEQQVDQVPISIRLSEALARLWAEATQTPQQLVPLTLALDWSLKHKSLRGVAADAHQMLKVLLLFINKLAAENERRNLNTLKGNTSIG
jgi:Fe-S-cluster containining protein